MSSKFRAQFYYNQTAEWALQYVDFDKANALIEYEHSIYGDDKNMGGSFTFRQRLSSFGSRKGSRNSIGSRGSGYSTPGNLDETYPLNPGTFRQLLDEEMDKVNAFCKQKLSESDKRLAEITEYFNSPGHDAAVLRGALVSSCRQYMMLQNYCNINAAAIFELAEKRSPAFRKMLADKLDEAGVPLIIAAAESTVPEAIQHITEMHADCSHNGDIAEAQSDLEASRQSKPMKFWEVFSVGMFLGLSIPLAILIVFSVALSPSLESKGFDWERLLTVAPILRAGLCLNITNWLWALAVTVMKKHRVNFSFVLNLNPTTALSTHHICRMAAFNSFLWLFFLLLYIGSAQGQISFGLHPPEFWVQAYVVTWVIFQIAPVGIDAPRATRWWIARQMLGVFIAPFETVTFATNFVGDYLTSTVKVLIDLEYTACFMAVQVAHDMDFGHCYNSSAQFAITGLPLYWRMMQCARRYYDTNNTDHIINFGKYFVSVLAVVAGTIWPHYRTWSTSFSLGHWLQIALLVTATTYSYSWDILKDWGLFVKQEDNSWGYRRMYVRYRHWAAFCSMTNLIGRCAWMYTIMVRPPGSRWEKEIVTFFTAIVEIYRRTQWSVLRIGNEHFNNVGAYRAMTAAPLTFSDGTMFEPVEAHNAADDVQAFLSEKRQALKEKANSRSLLTRGSSSRRSVAEPSEDLTTKTSASNFSTAKVMKTLDAGDYAEIKD